MVWFVCGGVLVWIAIYSACLLISVGCACTCAHLWHVWLSIVRLCDLNLCAFPLYRTLCIDVWFNRCDIICEHLRLLINIRCAILHALIGYYNPAFFFFEPQHAGTYLLQCNQWLFQISC